MLFKNKKGQSTAEYAVVIGLVVAVAAGVLQVALKKGIMRKQAQTINVLNKSGNTASAGVLKDSMDQDVNFADLATNEEENLGLYSQSARKTTVNQAGYVDEKVTQKGGIEKAHSKSTSETTAVDIETVKSAEVT